MEVSTINRVSARAGSPLIAAANVKPSISGIWTSRSATSYGWPSADGGSQSVKGFVTAGGAAHLHLPRPNLVAQDLAVGVVVVDHQHPHVQLVMG